MWLTHEHGLWDMEGPYAYAFERIYLEWNFWFKIHVKCLKWRQPSYWFFGALYIFATWNTPLALLAFSLCHGVTPWILLKLWKGLIYTSLPVWFVVSVFQKIFVVTMSRFSGISQEQYHGAFYIQVQPSPEPGSECGMVRSQYQHSFRRCDRSRKTCRWSCSSHTAGLHGLPVTRELCGFVVEWASSFQLRWCRGHVLILVKTRCHALFELKTPIYYGLTDSHTTMSSFFF